MVSRMVAQPCVQKASAPTVTKDDMPPTPGPATGPSALTPPSTSTKSGGGDDAQRPSEGTTALTVGVQAERNVENVLEELKEKEKKDKDAFSISPVEVSSRMTASSEYKQQESLKASTKAPLSSEAPTANSNRIARAQMRERRVPETPIARVLAFSTLGAGLALGAAAESARRLFQTPSADSTAAASGIYSSFISDANAHRLADSLSRMRGAALKLGQMLSIQDEDVVPPIVSQALERVRQAADVMPRRQLESVLSLELGADWREKVVEFEDVPLAGASIGQVHRGVIEDEDSKRRDVVFKVQYPGVARSIRSDLANLKRLVTEGNVIPDSFYLGDELKAAQEELTLNVITDMKRLCNRNIVRWWQIMSVFLDGFMFQRCLRGFRQRKFWFLNLFRGCLWTV